MNILIITGLSGAGKSQAVDALEDLGYYCVDNVPPSLLLRFAQLSEKTAGGLENIALVVDVRSREMFQSFHEDLDLLSEAGYAYKLLFLDCSDDILLHRYKETRRRHPLQSETLVRLENAIAEERELLDFARENADYLVDSSEFTAAELKSRLKQLFARDNNGDMIISCASFGFKHGLPQDSDLVFDVRCLPNPYYVPELRHKTGLDREVCNFVLGFPQSQGLITRLLDFVDYLIPLYRQEGKSQLVISIGCTGGRHRSVVFAELLAVHLRENNRNVICNHRQIEE